MGFLEQAVIEMSAAKVGVFGPQGSGKSLNAFLIAIGFSIEHHNHAPIGMHDTEDATDWLLPIAEIEGVRVLRKKSTAFVDMVKVLRESEREGCCCYVQDQVSRPWKEIQSSFMEEKKIKRLDFQHWNELKDKWQRMYVDHYIASPLHCFVLGRAGFEYDTVEDDQGKRTQERVGTKMKAETEFGYEPHLLIEMEGRRVIPPSEEREGAKKKRRVRKQGGQFQYYAHVLKDRSRALNATEIRLPDVNNYRRGDYKKVFDVFAPHWALLKLGQAHKPIDIGTSSGSLFDSPNGESAHRQRRDRAAIALEEIEELMRAAWPGQSEDAKRGKREGLRVLFDTLSWTAVTKRSAEELESAAGVLKIFDNERRVSGIGDVDHALSLLGMVRDRMKAEGAPLVPEVGVVAEGEGQPF